MQIAAKILGQRELLGRMLRGKESPGLNTEFCYAQQSAWYGMPLYVCKVFPRYFYPDLTGSAWAEIRSLAHSVLGQGKAIKLVLLVEHVSQLRGLAQLVSDLEEEILKGNKAETMGCGPKGIPFETELPSSMPGPVNGGVPVEGAGDQIFPEDRPVIDLIVPKSAWKLGLERIRAWAAARERTVIPLSDTVLAFTTLLEEWRRQERENTVGKKPNSLALCADFWDSARALEKRLIDFHLLNHYFDNITRMVRLSRSRLWGSSLVGRMLVNLGWPRDRGVIYDALTGSILSSAKEVSTEGSWASIKEPSAEELVQMFQLNGHVVKSLYGSASQESNLDSVHASCVDLSMRDLLMPRGLVISAPRYTPENGEEQESFAQVERIKNLLRYFGWRYRDTFVLTLTDLGYGGRFLVLGDPKTSSGSDRNLRSRPFVNPRVQVVLTTLWVVAGELERLPLYLDRRDYLKANVLLSRKYRAALREIERFLLADDCGPSRTGLLASMPDPGSFAYERFLVGCLGDFLSTVYRISGRSAFMPWPVVVARYLFFAGRYLAQRLWRTPLGAFRRRHCAEPFLALPTRESRICSLCSSGAVSYLDAREIAEREAECDYVVNRRLRLSKNRQNVLTAAAKPHEAFCSEQSLLTATSESIYNLTSRDLVSGIWNTLDFFNNAESFDDIARLLAAAYARKPLHKYDRIVGIARTGAAFAALLALAFDKPLSILTIDPTFDSYPRILRGERILLIDDMLQTGHTICAAAEHLRRHGFKVQAEDCLVICHQDISESQAFAASAFCTGEALQLSKHVSSLCRVVFDPHGGRTGEEIFRLDHDDTAAVTDELLSHVTFLLKRHLKDAEALHKEMSQDQPPGLLDEKHAEFKSALASELRRRMRSHIYMYEHTGCLGNVLGWLRQLSAASPVLKRALAVNSPELLFRIATYFYLFYIRPMNIEVLISGSRWSLPIAVFVSVLSLYFENRPRRILLSQRGGTHILGLRKLYEEISNGSFSNSPKAAMLSLATATCRHERQILNTLETFKKYWNSEKRQDRQTADLGEICILTAADAQQIMYRPRLKAKMYSILDLPRPPGLTEDKLRQSWEEAHGKKLPKDEAARKHYARRRNYWRAPLKQMRSDEKVLSRLDESTRTALAKFLSPAIKIHAVTRTDSQVADISTEAIAIQTSDEVLEYLDKQEVLHGVLKIPDSPFDKWRKTSVKFINIY